MKQDICIHKRRYTLFCTISITGTEIPNRQTTVARFNNSNTGQPGGFEKSAWEEGRGCAAPSSPCQPATELCCGWRYANHEEDSRLSSSQGVFARLHEPLHSMGQRVKSRPLLFERVFCSNLRSIE
ncbi:hypothetical protein CEXT_368981 [Caerostris extrusa]|uniref:Uncharacterized protein n=1 Tax=Caerostris extrusa TaxID=172846 RepID=A0AAV4MNX4_CAEEX|nr:hypothetical protein CEXT_368981 [Caerostris extrusa]